MSADEEKRDPMLDLPLRPGAGAAEEEPVVRPAPAPPPVSEEFRRPEVPPPVRGRGPRRRRRWPLLVLLLAVLAGGGWLVFRWSIPVAGFSEESLAFAETRVGAAGEPLRVSITNEGRRPMRIQGLQVKGEAAAEFEIVTDECSGTTRAAGESCDVELRFAPAAAGERSGLLGIRGNALGELALRGAAVAPVVALERTEVEFGPQPVDGRAATRNLTLRNDGGVPLAFARIGLTGDHAGDFSLGDPCSARPLEPGGTCSLRLSFVPRAAGDRKAELVVESDAVNPVPPVALTGAGVWRGESLDPETERLDFGEQRVGRKSGARSVTLVNRTSEPLAVAAARLSSPAGGFALASDGCRSVTLAAGAGCEVSVTFTPAAEGPATAELEVRDGFGQAAVVALAGKGIEPRLRLGARQVDFGGTRVGFTKAEKVVLTNSGTAPLVFTRATLGGPGAAAFSKTRDGCSGMTLRPSRTCTIELDFRPPRTGVQRAELRIESDAAGGAGTVALTGSGTAPEFQVDAARLDFGTIQRPGSQTRRLTISNRGSARLLVQGVQVTGAGAADFAVAAVDCAEGGLAPKGSCTVTVRFAPVGDGGRSATLVIRHDAGGGPQRIELSGNALAPIPGIRVSPAELEFGLRQVGSRSDVQTLRISNPGPGKLVLGGLTLAGPNADDFRMVPGTCEGAPFIAAGSDCTVGIRFTPAAPGSRSATLRIRHNAPGREVVVSLRGQGV